MLPAEATASPGSASGQQRHHEWRRSVWEGLHTPTPQSDIETDHSRYGSSQRTTFLLAGEVRSWRPPAVGNFNRKWLILRQSGAAAIENSAVEANVEIIIRLDT